MSPPPGRNYFHVAPSYQPILREIGLDAEAAFTHPHIRVWRSIAERENCTLDATLIDGQKIRWHVKRHHAARGRTDPAHEEARGIQHLVRAGIATVTLIGWGRIEDGRSFLITEDLSGYEAADKLIERGVPFDRVLEPTADLAAKLHNAGLHHRDLYLCHFFAKLVDDRADLRLIDAARVKPLPRWFARRWLTKDLAQFWYSTLTLPVTDPQRQAWLERYARQRSLGDVPALRRAIEGKVAWIARHDPKLRARQPGRNVSIPDSSHFSR